MYAGFHSVGWQKRCLEILIEEPSLIPLSALVCPVRGRNRFTACEVARRRGFAAYNATAGLLL